MFGFEIVILYRFLQGPETDPATVKKIRQAIDNQTDVTVQLINYTKTGMLSINFPFFLPFKKEKSNFKIGFGFESHIYQ